MKADNSRMAAKVRAIRRAQPRALQEADKIIADGVVGDILIASPKDTHRYVRAMAQAANAAELGPFQVPALRPGRFAAQAKDRLESQLAFWEKWVRFYERLGGIGRAAKGYARAVKTRDRAREELAKWNPFAIIIFGGKNRRLKVTVRDKVYGGTGTKVVRDGRVAFVLHNKEAHASIVEKRSHTVKAALAKARAFGFKMGGRAYTRRILAAAGGTAFGLIGGRAK